MDTPKITAKELAALLDGREYMHEITKEEEAAAKASDLLVIFGRSDDLCELRGAIDDELDCYKGGPLELPALPDTVTAVWCPDDLFSWGYETSLPHTTFRIYEDGEPYCIGIVVDLTLAKAELYWCEECCNYDKFHVGMDGYAPCRFTSLLTFGQTYGKDCRGFNRPAESFVELVRCKDCKFFKYGDYCTEPKMEHSKCLENDFCSYGERSEQ